MILIVDGKEIKVLNEVKVIVGVDDLEDQELHLTLTHEGIIQDVIDAKGDIPITSSETYQEVLTRLEDEAFKILDSTFE